MRPRSQDSIIVGYYGGLRPDDRGRYLSDIQRWPDELLEDHHDFIQWMFPLPEPSGVNPDAPILDEPTIAAFLARPELQEKLRLSFIRMLYFYGLEITSGPLRVVRAANFRERAENWLSVGNHNHLRITRILKCLSLLGLRQEAGAFFECLSGIYCEERRHNVRISERTFRFWQSAVE